MHRNILIILCFTFSYKILLVSQSGYALKFDGNDDHVIINHTESLNITKAITIEAWIYPTAVGSTNGDVAILSKDELLGGGGNFSYALAFRFRKGLRCSFNNFTVDLSTADNSINLHEWTHVACTYDGDSIIAYINGQSINSRAYSEDVYSNSYPLYLGVWYQNNTEYSFIGTMDEIRLWNYARSENEIQSTMNIGLSDADSGLVGYWKFDEGIGDTTSDASGAGNNGLLVSGPQWIRSHITSISNDLNTISNDIILFNNYPNPFNPQTTISYELKQSKKVNLTVFDISGEKIIQLLNQPQSAGLHNITFDASGLSSGIYFYRLETDNFIETKKMILLK